MRSILRRRRTHTEAEDDLPEVSQPAPLSSPGPKALVVPRVDVVVTELTELEARALCAREGIPVFWPRPGSRRSS